jgi:hypothetical protein
LEIKKSAHDVNDVAEDKSFGDMGLDDLENEYNFNREEDSDLGDQALAPGGFNSKNVTKEML